VLANLRGPSDDLLDQPRRFGLFKHWGALNFFGVTREYGVTWSSLTAILGPVSSTSIQLSLRNASAASLRYAVPYLPPGASRRPPLDCAQLSGPLVMRHGSPPHGYLPSPPYSAISFMSSTPRCPTHACALSRLQGKARFEQARELSQIKVVAPTGNHSSDSSKTCELDCGSAGDLQGAVIIRKERCPYVIRG
jgi:hypothetical protein